MILGASFDTPEENLAFAEAQGFPFRLLSDPDHTVGARYEATRDAGDQYADYPKRISYLIDPDGIVRKAYDVTDPAGHAEQVAADVESLRAE